MSLAVNQVLTNVFSLESETGQRGTGFVLTRSDRQFLVTAEHGFSSDPDQTVLLRRFYDDQTAHMLLRRVNPAEGASDILIFELETQLDIPFALPAVDDAGVMQGQDALIAGFPNVGASLTATVQGLPFPTVLPMCKQGIVSGFSRDLLYIDTIANTGFSGSPVVYRHQESAEVRIAGMVVQTVTEELALRGIVGEPHQAAGLTVCVSSRRILDEFERSAI